MTNIPRTDIKRKRKRSGQMKPEPPPVPLDQPGRYQTRHVLWVTSWSHSTLYTRIADGMFPRPQKDGRLNYWDTAVIRGALKL